MRVAMVSLLGSGRQPGRVRAGDDCPDRERRRERRSSAGRRTDSIDACAGAARAYRSRRRSEARSAQRATPAHRHHLAAHEGDLRRQRQVLRADVVAGEQRHAAEHAVVVADHLVVVVVGARVARVEAEARDLVQADRADEVLAHARGAAGGDAAAALDAAVELVDLVGQLGLHRLLDARAGRTRVASCAARPRAARSCRASTCRC